MAMDKFVEETLRRSPSEIFNYVYNLPEEEKQAKFEELLGKLQKEIEQKEKHVLSTAFVVFLLASSSQNRSHGNLEKLKNVLIENKQLSDKHKSAFAFIIATSLDDERYINNLSVNFIKALKETLPANDRDYDRVREIYDIFEEIIVEERLA